MTQISESDLRERIGTTEPPRFLGFLWTTGHSFFDGTTFRRDLERVSRFYRAHGYYSATPVAVDMTRNPNDRHEIDLDVHIREGRPTTVGTVWISGCEPASRTPDDAWTATDATCARIRDGIALRTGAVFTEDSLARDQQFITDSLRNEGRALARVSTRVTVDPVRHRADVVYLLEPGAPSQFGRVFFHEPGNSDAATRALPRSNFSVETLQRAIRIRPGQQYTRSAIADTQAAILRLGLHAIVRIEETNVDCDSRGRCGDDAGRNRDDPQRYVRVDLHIRLSPARWVRWRVGGGFEYEMRGPNLHLLFDYQNVNVNLPVLPRRLRFSIGPVFYFPVLASPPRPQAFEPGLTALLEMRQNEIWSQGDFVFRVPVDLGLDPINPNLTSRFAIRPSVGLEYVLSNNWTGSTYLRTVGLAYYAGLADAARAAELAVDPIYRQQYFDQFYYYFEQQFQYDGRDNPLQTRRGTFFRGGFQNGFAIPGVSLYSFLRATLELRGFIPLSTNVVLALRGFAGIAVGLSAETRNGWPVPAELRFYSGGSSSNRGYPANRVGRLITVPQRNCLDPGFAADQRWRCNADPANEVDRPPAERFGGTYADESRLVSIGGLLGWEFAAELRWYIGNVGLVAFLDMSDVRGWQPGSPTSRSTSSVPPTAPQSSLGAAFEPSPFDPHAPGETQSPVIFEPHPSVGVGFRYVTAIGVIRLDAGVRLADLTCSAYTDAVRYQNSVTRNSMPVDAAGRPAPALVPVSGWPWYYAVSQPPCDVFGIRGIPMALHFAIGEAF